MLQEANPKFYKEQLMMAVWGIELGARCRNRSAHQARGSPAELLRAPCLGRGWGPLLTPPAFVGIAVPLAQPLQSHGRCAGGGRSTAECFSSVWTQSLNNGSIKGG